MRAGSKKVFSWPGSLWWIVNVNIYVIDKLFWGCRLHSYHQQMFRLFVPIFCLTAKGFSLQSGIPSAIKYNAAIKCLFTKYALFWMNKKWINVNRNFNLLARYESPAGDSRVHSPASPPHAHWLGWETRGGSKVNKTQCCKLYTRHFKSLLKVLSHSNKYFFFLCSN